MNQAFDIIILGGGMVGLSMAAALADTPLKIGLLEKQDFTELKKLLARNNSITDDKSADNKKAANRDDHSALSGKYDLRVSAISPGNEKFLTQLGCWQHIPKDRIADYELMRVWDADSNGSICFDASKMALAKLGTIVENDQLRAAIYQQIKSQNNLQIVASQSIESIKQANQSIQIHTSQQQTFAAKLLIAADGAFSPSRQLLNIPTESFSYQQTAFVATLKTQLHHQNTAWQRFTANGPVAFLPLPEKNLCSIVWSIDQIEADKLHLLPAKEFSQRLNQAFDYRLGEIELLGEPLSFPLIKQHANHYLAKRSVLIGDAAHTIHPLAGQGVNIGFQDVANLSELIIKLHKNNRDFSLLENLRPYERARRSQNYLMQNSMSGFKSLFGSKQQSIRLLRGFALSAVDRLDLVKQLVMRHAMGL